MKRVGVLVVVACAAVAVLLFVSSPGAAVKQQLKKGDMATICKAGKDAPAMAVADPASCKTGAEKEKLSVLKIEDDVAVLCGCGHGCVCEMHATNAYKCSCNTPVRVVKLMQ